MNTIPEIKSTLEKECNLQLVQEYNQLFKFRECSGKSYEYIKEKVSNFSNKHGVNLRIENDYIKDCTYIIF